MGFEVFCVGLFLVCGLFWSLGVFLSFFGSFCEMEAVFHVGLVYEIKHSDIS